ncbi:hypothetical protein F441_04412 [Phytophthora nicotianae CJ01A1]|uniref:Uncharacterized protein n=1 Tax=Phytophthora nicotianae CJ01A1 TaxID=1317063 RepID=W2XH88_PHYNI|nr:hypothetical protein F441_04412 [Phytophthora nicotianae CJ01A1]
MVQVRASLVKALESVLLRRRRSPLALALRAFKDANRVNRVSSKCLTSGTNRTLYTDCNRVRFTIFNFLDQLC